MNSEVTATNLDQSDDTTPCRPIDDAIAAAEKEYQETGILIDACTAFAQLRHKYFLAQR